MVRGWKFIVLLGGVVGIAAFFFPFLIVSGQGKEVSVSAFGAVTGLEAIEESADSAEVKAANAQLVEIIDKVQVFLYAVYAPAVLIALFGLIGVARMRYGRVLAFFTLVVGAATIA